MKKPVGLLLINILIFQEHASSSVNAQLRRGRVIFDGWSMSAKMVDLPTIIESMKTIDKKTFYKSADISQILICREGDTSSEDEELEQTAKVWKIRKPLNVLE